MPRSAAAAAGRGRVPLEGGIDVMQYSVSLPRANASAEFSSPDGLGEIAQALERAALDSCALIDHPFPFLEDPRAGGQALDIFALAGFIAAATDRLVIHLNLIVMGLRNPFLVARAVSTLDHLAKGRLLVGVGAGYMEREFGALGADYSHRVALVDEGVIAMKEAWSGEPVTLDGAGWTARGNVMLPRPYTDPHPKLFRGGNTTAAMRSAVAHFDGWSPFEAPSELARTARTAAIGSRVALAARVAKLRELESRSGRSTDLLITLNKSDPTWLQAGSEAVREEVGRLEEIGISRLVVALPASGMSEFIERVEGFATMVGLRP